MGSGSSSYSNNKGVDASNSEECISRPSSNTRKKLRNSPAKVHSITSENQEIDDGHITKDSSDKAKKAEMQCKILEEQLAQLEVSNLDLQDQIQNLELRLEYAQQLHTEDEEGKVESHEEDGGACQETVKAKNLLIEKLQDEIKTTQYEMKKLRIQCKRKLKALKSKSVEDSQGSTMKVYELTTEITHLKEENRSLHEQLQKSSKNDSTAVNNVTDSAGLDADSRMKLVVDLSAQVSQQEAKIIELENQQHEKDRQINELTQMLYDLKSDENKKKSTKMQNRHLDEFNQKDTKNHTKWDSSKFSDMRLQDRTYSVDSYNKWQRNSNTQDSFKLYSSPSHPESKNNFDSLYSDETNKDIDAKLNKQTSDPYNSPEADEMRQIAEEMRMLRKSSKCTKGKKKRAEALVKDDLSGVDFRGSSGHSRDSGIIDAGDDLSPTGYSKCAVNNVRHAGLSEVRRSQDKSISKKGIATEETTLVRTHTVLSDDDDTWANDLDMQENANTKASESDLSLNIRQISAPRKRPKSKDLSGVLDSRPPSSKSTAVQDSVRQNDDRFSHGEQMILRSKHKDDQTAEIKGELGVISKRIKSNNGTTFPDDLKEIDSLISSIDEETLALKRTAGKKSS